MKFYDSIGPNPRLVRMFMAEKGIDIPKQTVDLRGGENRQEAHLARNPHGQMPTLELDNGAYLSEITAICEYLEEIKPTPPLIGTTPEEREEYVRHAAWKPEREGEPSLPPERFAEMAEKEQFILTACANGYGKISSAYEYRRIGRGGQGVTNIDNIKRNGPVVASFTVEHGHELMLVTDQAKLIRLPVELRHLVEDDGKEEQAFQIRGRDTAGVRLFDVAENEHVVSAVRIDDVADPENDAEEAVVEEMIGRDSPEATIPTTRDRDDPPPTEPGGDAEED